MTTDPNDALIEEPHEEQPPEQSAEPASEQPGESPAADAYIDGLRANLIDEEKAAQSKPQAGWLSRVTRRLRLSPTKEAEEPAVQAFVDHSEVPSLDAVPEHEDRELVEPGGEYESFLLADRLEQYSLPEQADNKIVQVAPAFLPDEDEDHSAVESSPFLPAGSPVEDTPPVFVEEESIPSAFVQDESIEPWHPDDVDYRDWAAAEPDAQPAPAEPEAENPVPVEPIALQAPDDSEPDPEEFLQSLQREEFVQEELPPDPLTQFLSDLREKDGDEAENWGTPTHHQPQTPPPPAAPEPKKGLLARVTGFLRPTAAAQNDRYAVQDDTVTGRLQTSTLQGKDADLPVRSSSAEALNQRFGQTSPFTQPVEDEHSLPKTEDDYWERLSQRSEQAAEGVDLADEGWRSRVSTGAQPLDDTGEGPKYDPVLWGIRDELTVEDDAESSLTTTSDAIPEVPVVTPQRTVLIPTPGEEGIDSEEIRAIALEDYQDVPVEERGVIVKEPRLRPWVKKHTTAILLVALVVVAVVAGLTFGLPYMQARARAAVTPAPPVVDAPHPNGLRLTGGWYFNLQVGEVVDGAWTPDTSEWLMGTEIRRVVALPWSRQAEAVFRSLLPGDELLLYISNDDVQTYEVEMVELVARADRDLYESREPSLLVILFQDDADERWILLAKRVSER